MASNGKFGLQLLASDITWDSRRDVKLSREGKKPPPSHLTLEEAKVQINLASKIGVALLFFATSCLLTMLVAKVSRTWQLK